MNSRRLKDAPDATRQGILATNLGPLKGLLMSHLGQPTFAVQEVMSALLPIAYTRSAIAYAETRPFIALARDP